MSSFIIIVEHSDTPFCVDCIYLREAKSNEIMTSSLNSICSISEKEISCFDLGCKHFLHNDSKN